MTSADDHSPSTRLRREPPTFRRVRVRSVELLTPHMRRVVLGGDELDGFAIEGPASSVRLLLPATDSGELVMPNWTGNQFELPNGERAPIRTFTPRLFHADRRELTIDVVLHEQGAATDWVRSAEIGDDVAISGPGRHDPVDPHARSHLLAGDESTIPAIAQLLEAIAPHCQVTVHIEITARDARVELPDHPNANVTWHELASGGPPGEAMVEAVVATAELPDGIWVAGEAAAVQRLRTHLFDERGRTRRNVTARGYWKLARSATT